MKYLLITTTGLLLIGCSATNPGNIGAAMQKRAMMQGSGPVMIEGKLATSPETTCEELDNAVKAAYLDMQPEKENFGERVVSTSKGIGETVALQKANNAVPGAGMVNQLFKAKKGKEKVSNMLGEQMEGAVRLRQLNNARVTKGCPGSTMELFQEK